LHYNVGKCVFFARISVRSTPMPAIPRGAVAAVVD